MSLYLRNRLVDISIRYNSCKILLRRANKVQENVKLSVVRSLRWCGVVTLQLAYIVN
jgi:hypothetical protein